MEKKVFSCLLKDDSELAEVTSVCMYVCMCVIQQKAHFRSAVHFDGIPDKFVYEGRCVKVKVTEAKKRKIPHSRNVKLGSAITSVL